MKTKRDSTARRRPVLSNSAKTFGELCRDHDIDDSEWYQAGADGEYIQHPTFIDKTAFEFFAAPIILFAKNSRKFIGVAYNDERFYERTGIAPTCPFEPEAKLPPAADNDGEEWKGVE